MGQRIHGGDGHDHGHDAGGYGTGADGAYGTHSFYEGGDYTLDPKKVNSSFTYGTGYAGIKGGLLGSNPANPTSSNQLGEAVAAIKQGSKAFEVQMLGLGQNDPDQGMPIQHFKELRALMELSGVKPSVHGPLVDPAGFGQGGWGGEEHRKLNERKMFEAIKKSYILDPEKNIPVVFHTGNASGYVKSYVPDPNDPLKKKTEILPIINLETNQVANVKDEYEYSIGSPLKELEGEGRLKTAESRIKTQNESSWDDQLNQVAMAKKYVDESIDKTRGMAKEIEVSDSMKLAALRVGNEEDLKKFSDAMSKNPYIEREYTRAKIFSENNEKHLNTLFHKAYKYGEPEQKEKLKKLSQEWQDEMREYSRQSKEHGINPIGALGFESAMQEKYLRGIKGVTDEGGAPKIHQDADKFAFDQAAKSFGNVAAKGYVAWGNKAPVIAIENTYEGLGWSDADSHRTLIDKSRKVFVEEVMKEKKNISKKEAEKLADKFIGATWDVSHINIAKSKGFGDEYVISETAKMRDYVKHVHLADNFGFSDSHLAPGMGNTPIKKILEALEKDGKLAEMRMIVESGGFGGPFKKPMHTASLNAFGSGFSYGQGWDSSMIPGNYFGGYGEINPEVHHSLYGSGFSGLPTSFGGQVGGQKSRFGGTPMA